MKRSSLYLFVLAVAAPLCAEIFNGSTPFSDLTHISSWIYIILPYSFLVIILAYFVGKTHKHNGALFLLPIAGLVIEGLLTRSLFNPVYGQLSNLAAIGRFAGVQWPWTISLLLSHMMVSFLLPLAIADYFAPEQKVSRRAFLISVGGLAAIVMATFLVAPSDFTSFWPQIVVTLAVISLLVYVSRHASLPVPKERNLSWGWFFLAGFLFAPLNWLSSFFLAGFGTGYVLLAQIVFAIIYIYFLWSFWFERKTSSQKKMVFVLGYFIPYVIVFVLIGFGIL